MTARGKGQLTMADKKYFDIIKQGGEAWGKFVDEIYGDLIWLTT